MMFPLLCVLFTPSLTSICDVNQCLPVPNFELVSTWDFRHSGNFDTSSIRAVQLSGTAQEKCELSFKSMNQRSDKYGEINITVNADTMTMWSDYSEYSVTSVMRKNNFNISDNHIDFTIEFLNQDELFLKVYSSTQTMGSFSYGDLDQTDNEIPKLTFRKLLAGEKLSINDLIGSRTIRSQGCHSDVTVHLCPCRSPVIASLDLTGTELRCTAHSLDPLTISWDSGGENPATENPSGSRAFTSRLRNVTEPGTYSCVAETAAGQQVSRQFVLENEESEAATRGGDRWKKVTVPVIVVVIVVVAGSSIAAVWCLKRRHQRKVERVGNLPQPSFRMISEPPPGVGMEPTLASGIQPTFQDIAPPEFTPTPIYAALSLGRSPQPEESIYNRLDPNTMTTSRDGWRTLQMQGAWGTMPRNRHVLLSNQHAMPGNNPVASPAMFHTLPHNASHYHRDESHGMAPLQSTFTSISGNSMSSNNPPTFKPPQPPSIRFALAPSNRDSGVYQETLDLNL